MAVLKEAFVNHLPEDMGATFEPSAPSVAGTVVRAGGGMVLMLIGVTAVVGGIILHFAEKAERFVVFPFAGRLLILVGIGVSCIAMAVSGARMAVRFGILTLVVGIGMFVFGYSNLSNPSLRFYAPLGFFVSLAGGLFIWGGREFAKEAQSR
jgi:hypothetical protein